MAPAAPVRNTARNVSRSTSRVLRDELSRARRLMDEARARGTVESWQALFEPVDLSRELPARLVLTVDAPSTEAREKAAGWVLGHLTALVYRLEGDRRVFARPLPSSASTGPFLIGLDARSAPRGALTQTVEEFRASFREWSHRPEGATLEVDLTA
jgi:poly(A) polymerase